MPPLYWCCMHCMVTVRWTKRSGAAGGQAERTSYYIPYRLRTNHIRKDRHFEPTIYARTDTRVACIHMHGAEESTKKITNTKYKIPQKQNKKLPTIYQPYHAIPYHTIPCHAMPYHTIGVLPSTQPLATFGSSFILSYHTIPTCQLAGTVDYQTLPWLLEYAVLLDPLRFSAVQFSCFLSSIILFKVQFSVAAW